MSDKTDSTQPSETSIQDHIPDESHTDTIHSSTVAIDTSHTDETSPDRIGSTQTSITQNAGPQKHHEDTTPVPSQIHQMQDVLLVPYKPLDSPEVSNTVQHYANRPDQSLKLGRPKLQDPVIGYLRHLQRRDMFPHSGEPPKSVPFRKEFWIRQGLPVPPPKPPASSATITQQKPPSYPKDVIRERFAVARTLEQYMKLRQRLEKREADSSTKQ